MLYFSGLQREINVKKVLRGIGLRTVSRFLALRLAFAFHFSALPLSDILTRANRPPRHPQTPPARHGSPPATRRHGKACRFAFILVPVGTQATSYAWTQ
jgi:hypothetical protein